jgi:hypothetical protein
MKSNYLANDRQISTKIPKRSTSIKPTEHINGFTLQNSTARTLDSIIAPLAQPELRSMVVQREELKIKKVSELISKNACLKREINLTTQPCWEDPRKGRKRKLEVSLSKEK